ncbi:MAG: hypothetical protein ACYS22_11460 [Planctomycetota bacterium]|jgi:hypothetical protein
MSKLQNSAPPTTLVVTTINPPNAILRELAAGCEAAGWRFVVVGDQKSPDDFALPGASFFDLGAQRATGFATATQCPTGHYARKNVGYLIAIRSGAELIVETDDGNRPKPEFFSP